MYSMNGKEAIIKLLSGEKVRRSIWNFDQYWFLKDNKLCNQENIVFNMTFNELIIGNDWEVYNNLLNSFEALHSLKNGKKIKHKDWDESEFLFLMDNQIFDHENSLYIIQIENIRDKVWIELDN